VTRSDATRPDEDRNDREVGSRPDPEILAANRELKLHSLMHGMPLAVPVEYFEDGCPAYDTWLTELGGDYQLLERFHEWAHERGDKLSRRWIRRMKRGFVAWARDTQAVWFAPCECEACGERFHPQRVHAYYPSYCSNACRRRAYRARKKAASKT
jgi:hypothetical protein